MVPATMFYSDTLEAAAKDVSLIQWSGLPNPKIPIAFYGNDTEESWIDEVSHHLILVVSSVADLIGGCKLTELDG